MMKLTRALVAPLVAAAVLAGGGAAIASATSGTTSHPQASSNARSAVKPTIVLVHGAFADSTSWSSEITFLEGKGYQVVAVANPLRSVASDSAYLLSVLKTISGPIVLVGHSYAGFLISAAAAKDPEVKALVYVAAYIPRKGETPADLTYKFPGSELTGSNLIERAEPGGTDIYINPADFASVYAGGLSPSEVAIASVVQRPITAAALNDPATVNPPSATPKWEIVALEDHAIPPRAEKFMAARAHATVVTTNSGHDVPAARPWVVDKVILQAAHSVS
ncbi:MAG TPA: alpha/beta hydrolase [Streptosporangiaceae bacterium]|jgi:pimeloyl-ACP methyl ester carboxylesterase